MIELEILRIGPTMAYQWGQFVTPLPARAWCALYKGLQQGQASLQMAHGLANLPFVATYRFILYEFGSAVSLLEILNLI